jgi:peptidylprolyl isomerase
MKRSITLLLVLILVAAATLLAQTGGQQSSSPTTSTQKTTSTTSKSTTAKSATTAHPTPAWITTGSGLKYQDVVVGKGPQPKVGDTVVVNYTGKFTNGKVFDTSVGKPPFQFVLGRGQVIKGWDEGVGSMHVGGKRKLVIPPDLAYGAGGYPDPRDQSKYIIPPKSTLTFDVELLKIK